MGRPEWSQEECDEIKKGGNRRAHKKWLTNWDLEIFARPASDDVDRIKDFIRKAFIIKCWQKQPKKPFSSALVPPAVKAPQQANAEQTSEESQAGNAEGSAAVDAGVVHKDVAADAAAQGMVLLDKTAAWFCAVHDSSEKRCKTEPSYKPCGSCNTMMHTNYTSFAFCPKCSAAKSLCMICGAGQHSTSQQQESCDLLDHKIGDDPVGTSTPTTAGGDADSTSDAGSNAPSADCQIINNAPQSCVDLLDLDLMGSDAHPAHDTSVSQVPAVAASARCQSTDVSLLEFDACPPKNNSALQSSPALVSSTSERESFAADLESLFAAGTTSLSTAGTKQNVVAMFGPDTSQEKACTNSTASSSGVTLRQEYKPWRPANKSQSLADHAAKRPEPSGYSNEIQNLSASQISTSPLDVCRKQQNIQVAEFAGQRSGDKQKNYSAIYMPPPEQMEPVAEKSYSITPAFGDLILAMEEKSIGWEKQ